VTAAARQEPTREQLALAFRQISRPGWPASLDDALARPHFAAALRGIAVNLRRASACPAPRRPGPASAPPAPPVQADPRQRMATPTRFDAKRAAANDIDD
jgi:hypothetical protein